MQVIDALELFFENLSYLDDRKEKSEHYCPLELVNGAGPVPESARTAIYLTALVCLADGLVEAVTLADLEEAAAAAQKRCDLGLISHEELVGQAQAVYKAFIAWCDQNIERLALADAMMDNRENPSGRQARPTQQQLNAIKNRAIVNAKQGGSPKQKKQVVAFWAKMQAKLIAMGILREQIQ